MTTTPPLLLPPDLRDWVSPDHMVHFIMNAVKALVLNRARTNQRGTGSAHSEHDSICMFRGENQDLLSDGFHQVLELAGSQAKEQCTGKKPRGKAPEPPKEGPRDKDQHNFTD